jgi:hypothetical protein
VPNVLRHPLYNHRFTARDARVTDIYHRIECRQQVEIEVWPARAELSFGDDWTANPISTQTRFEAIVYNSDQGYLWEVRALDGNPGLGTIDASGVYRAPPKGSLPNGFTEIIVATCREDRLRKAYAWVTLVGIGPQPLPEPTVEIWPKRVTLYYAQGHNNNYIDDSNKMRQFQATPRNTSAPTVQWYFDTPGGGTHAGGTGEWFLYRSPDVGGTTTVPVRVQLQANASIFDEATVLLRNYDVPPLPPL